MPSDAEEGRGKTPSAGMRLCSGADQTALTEIACELKARLGAIPGSVLVVASPTTSEVTLDDASRLSARVARVVAGALGAGAEHLERAAKLDEARARAAERGKLLFLEVALDRGTLNVTADLYPVPDGFWDRVRDPRPSPSAHAFASRRADAEVRSFLPPVPLVAKRVSRVPAPERQIVALGCGDVAGAGFSEIVVVGRHRLFVGNVRQGRFVARATAEWSALSPVAPAPLREPLAGVWIRSPGHVQVGLSDRAHLVELDGDLRLRSRAERQIPWAAAGCTTIREQALSARLTSCGRDDAPLPLSLSQPIDALAGARLVDPGGKAHRVLAARVAGEDEAWLLQPEGRRRARVRGVGAQLAVGDLNGDGQAELLSGLATLDAKKDALVVHSWLASGEAKESLRLAVPSGVHALAVCPWEGGGMQPVVVATDSELWVVE